MIQLGENLRYTLCTNACILYELSLHLHFIIYIRSIPPCQDELSYKKKNNVTLVHKVASILNSRCLVTQIFCQIMRRGRCLVCWIVALLLPAIACGPSVNAHGEWPVVITFIYEISPKAYFEKHQQLERRNAKNWRSYILSYTFVIYIRS